MLDRDERDSRGQDRSPVLSEEGGVVSSHNARPFLGSPSLSLPRLFLLRLVVTGFGNAWSVGGTQWQTSNTLPPNRILPKYFDSLTVLKLVTYVHKNSRPISRKVAAPITGQSYGTFECGFAGAQIGKSISSAAFIAHKRK